MKLFPIRLNHLAMYITFIISVLLLIVIFESFISTIPADYSLEMPIW